MRTQFLRPRRGSWRDRRLLVYIELRDLWIGAFVARDAVYVVPLPGLVFRWDRALPGSLWAAEPTDHPSSPPVGGGDR